MLLLRFVDYIAFVAVENMSSEANSSTLAKHGKSERAISHKCVVSDNVRARQPQDLPMQAFLSADMI